jgi:hypothetical protein
MSERSPIVAGAFYPGSASALRTQVDQLLQTGTRASKAVGCVVPHAGYVYSGPVAGAVLGAVEVPKRVILLGPNHSGAGERVAVAPHTAWATPLASVPVDRDLADAVLTTVPGAASDSAAHQREHSLEVILPFLQVRNPDVRVLPICLSHLGFDECQAIGEGLATVVSEASDPVLIVASSDMSHYEPDEVTRQRDRLAIDATLSLDPQALYDTVHRERITMCGVIPTTVLLVAAGKLAAHNAELIAYETSGDRSGDRSAVVGYAGIRVAA